MAGVKGVQTTIGEYTIDDSEPVRQKVCSLPCPPAVVRLNICLRNSTFRCKARVGMLLRPTHSLGFPFCCETSCLRMSPCSCAHDLWKQPYEHCACNRAWPSAVVFDPLAVLPAHWAICFHDNAMTMQCVRLTRQPVTSAVVLSKPKWDDRCSSSLSGHH